MKTESTDIITHVCWDMDPQTSARCTLEPEHDGDHYTPYTTPWNQPGTSWPAMAPTLAEKSQK
ncbi:hypothetical protein ACFRQM_12125 [Streptomyces sp. NPDC056831]|uniref:hypothetical protein n=1 Tax=Streptomyces sp. NPDC056831 TaxID=3345954 RepID=UPI00369B8348